jgi:hypothetical protein
MRNAFRILARKSEEKDHLEDIDVVRMILATGCEEKAGHFLTS